MWYPSAFVPIVRSDFENQMRELPEQQNYVFWWSIWSDKNALKIKKNVLSETRPVQITDWKPEERRFTVTDGEPTKVRIATFYYPRWKAEVNGNEVETEPDINGAILIPLPAEKANVRLYFQEPASIRIASIFSIITWLFLSFMFLWQLRKKAVHAKNYHSQFTEEFTY